jgi:hypothetical protein
MVNKRAIANVKIDVVRMRDVAEVLSSYFCFLVMLRSIVSLLSVPFSHTKELEVSLVRDSRVGKVGDFERKGGACTSSWSSLFGRSFAALRLQYDVPTDTVPVADSLTAPKTGILALSLEAHDLHTHLFPVKKNLDPTKMQLERHTKPSAHFRIVSKRKAIVSV